MTLALLTLLLAPQVPRPQLPPPPDPEYLGWQLVEEQRLPVGNAEVLRIGRVEDEDGDGRTELVVEGADAAQGVAWTVHGSRSGDLLERGEGPAPAAWFAPARGREELARGRFVDPAWQPSGTFGATWFELDVDGDALPDALVLDPMATVAGDLGPRPALHVFRGDGVRLVSRREERYGERQVVGLLDPGAGEEGAGEERAVRIALWSSGAGLRVLRLERAGEPRVLAVRGRLERRAVPSTFERIGPADSAVGDAADVVVLDVLAAAGAADPVAELAARRARILERRPGAVVLVGLAPAAGDPDGERGPEPGTVLAGRVQQLVAGRAADGIWLQDPRPERGVLARARAVLGEDLLLLAAGEPSLANASLLDGVHLVWHAGREPAWRFEQRLAAWEDALGGARLVAVTFDGQGLDQGDRRRAWTWLLARHEGVVRGLPAILPPGRLGRPVERAFQDESGTIQRDCERGRIVSTAVSWSPTRVREDGPHRSLFTGQVAWEHLFPRGSSDVLLALDGEPTDPPAEDGAR